MKYLWHTLQQLLSLVGYQLIVVGRGNKAPQDPLNSFFRVVKGLGLDPKHIIDIGANRGEWTRTASKYFPKAHYTMLEPQIRFRDRVRDLEAAGIGLTWINAGAGDQAGRLKLHVPACDTSASFVPIDETTDGKGVELIEVDVLTLDDVVAQSPRGIPEMVKIDAEGFDLKVVQGARTLIGKTELFLIEAAVFDPKVENTLFNTINLMDRLGYAPLDVSDINRCAKSGALWLIEMPFLRKDSPLWSRMPPYTASFVPY